MKCLKNIIAKYKIKPDIDYTIELAKNGNASAFKAIEFIHKKYLTDFNASDFYKIRNKIISSLSRERYLSIFLDKTLFNYNTYYPWCETKDKKLYNYLFSKNNVQQEKKYYEKIIEMNNNNEQFDDIICKKLISDYGIICNSNLLKILIYMLPHIYNNQNAKNLNAIIYLIYNIRYIIKTYQLNIDFECLMILHKHAILDTFYHDITD
jgi:hypothetical protein